MADDWTVALALDFLADHFQGVASGVADDGAAPLKVGGVTRTTFPTYADGQRAELSMDTRGAAYAVLKDPGGVGTAGVDLSSLADAVAQRGAVRANGQGYLFNGSTWDRARTANVFKLVQNVAVVSGVPVTIWTPAASKKFRLMGFALSLSVTGRIALLDNAAAIGQNPSVVAGDSAGAIDLDNGILSAAANNPLKIDVSATGNVSGMAWGTEE